MSKLAEIHAMCDVLDEWLLDCEALSDEEVVDIREGIPMLKASANALITRIEGQMMDRAEKQPLKLGDKIFQVNPKGKRRAHHDQIKNLICGRAQTDPDTGEIFPLEQAVRRAVDFVYSAFVTRSSIPKKPFLREFGLKLEDVSFWEETGKSLDEKPADEDEKPEDDE